jgi:hypothetical protein
VLGEKMRQYTKKSKQDGFSDVRVSYRPHFKNKNKKKTMKKVGKHRARQENKKLLKENAMGI